jgi:iron complex transport system substrate-binding protein
MVPCGYTAEQARREWEQLPEPPNWTELPAVRAGQVFFLEANAYFSRPGPRLVDGVEQARAVAFGPDV